MVAEHGKDEHRGFWSSWPQAGVPLGNLLATAVLWVLAMVQSDEAFTAWGWRIPFLLSAVMVLIGLWVRLSLEDSPVFAEAKAEIEARGTTHLPILEVVRRYPKEVLLAMGMRMAENICTTSSRSSSSPTSRPTSGRPGAPSSVRCSSARACSSS